MIRLESPDWRLWLDPGRGVAWLAAEVRRDGGDWCAVVPDCRDGGGSLDAACFHMLPYSNRVRDGRFDFGGASVQLAQGERHSIHGALRKLPWDVVRSDDAALACRIDSREHEAVNWPWPIGATLDVRLDGTRLTSEMTLTNESERDMPAGLGWHPYFVREVAGAAPELTLPVTGVYPDATGDRLPDGAPVPLGEALDFRTARALDPDTFIDCCLSGFEGRARIAWPGAGVALELRASEACDHVVLFNPSAPHFAVEPVTNANDAFNLAERGVEGVGRAVLGPGETLAARLELELVRAAAG